MRLAAWPSLTYLDFPPMKIFHTTLLLLLLTITPIGAAASNPVLSGSAASMLAVEDAPDSGVPISSMKNKNMANILPDSSSMIPAKLSDQPPGASALDLSLFGIISLGIIGLFWIRRHTAEF